MRIATTICLFARDRVLQPTDELNAYFRCGIAFDLILNEPTLNFQLHHLEGSADAAVDDSVVAEIREISWKLHKLGEWIVVKHERELVAGGRPVGDGRLDVEIHSGILNLYRNLLT